MSFPKNDPYWLEALDYAQKQIRPGDSVFAQDDLLQFFPKARPYQFITRRGLDECDWIILHKDYAPRLGVRIMARLKEEFEAPYANAVFVVFRNKRSDAAGKGPGDFDPTHLTAVWKTVEELERNPAAPNRILAGLEKSYDPPGVFDRMLKNLHAHFFSPKALIVTLEKDGGFLANFKRVMSHLVHSLHRDGIRGIRAEWHAPDPAIGHNFPYGRPEDGNLWDCFFEPIPTRIEPGWETITTSIAADVTISGMHAHYLYKEGGQWRRKYHAAFRRYIRVRPHILERVDAFHAKHMAGRRVIGVHVRNEAHKVEYLTGEAMGFDGYVARVRELMSSRGKDCLVFLATDVEEAVLRFRETFGDRVLVQPGVARLLEKPTGDNRQQLHHRNPSPGVKLGEDVLIDCLLLSKCEALIHTVSNVATTAGYINPGMQMVYCE